MSGEAFQSLDVTTARRALSQLHERVCCSKGRIEIKRRGSDDVCVIISKAELDSLEHALEILSETSEFRAMCANLEQVAAATTGFVAAPAQA
jgi:PHD/YefM family antitoxin component YafN of YafNO toxin-antitoxin module